jgi:PAS domain S-box-containing protein
MTTNYTLVEREREITIEFLRLVNESTGTKDLVRAATAFFQRQSGCEAVGIRLREGEDYPYYETRGFLQKFVLDEKSLCARDSANCVIRDSSGNPIIECMCGNVICGRFNPAKRFFTERGSFWTNSTTELLATTTEADRQSRTRNRCNGEGYESVALLPLRFGDQRLGLLQLNDRRKGVFTLETIKLWERLADQLAVALSKFRAEETLRESEQRFRSLFENMVEGYAYCRMLFDEGRPQDFIYLEVNATFEKLTGLTNVAGKKVTEVVPGIREADPELFEIYGRVALTGMPERFEMFVKALSAWYQISVYCPKKEHFIAVFDVITERKQTEELLRESEKKYKDLFDSTLDGMYQVNTEGIFVLMNPAGARIFGYESPGEILGKNALEFWRDPKDRDVYREELKRQRKLSAYPMRAKKKNGEPLELESSTRIIEDDKGNFLGIEGILRDVTDRKRAEEQLRESESKFRSLAEQSLVGTYIIQDGRFKYVSPRLAEMFAYPVEDIVDRKGPLDLVVPDDHHLVTENIKRRMSGEAPFSHYEVRGQTRSGEIINIDVFGSTTNYHGWPAIIGVVLDITANKKLENQLRQAQKMEAVGQLTGGIAHDFNNILSAIIGYASLLNMKLSGDDPLRLFVDQILAGTERAANLTRSLLTFSRKQLSNLMPVDVNAVIGRVDKLLHSIIGEDIDLRLALALRDLTVNADAGQLEQILMNLATNARDAMPHGGILSIESAVVESGDILERQQDPGAKKYVLISVTDTGVGMDEKTRERIFEPFFTTKDLGRGTGLGLSMVYGIVKQHNGNIHCYSEPGKGTTFKVYLPLLSSAEDRKKMKAGTGAPEVLRGGPETILVAEDDGALRSLSKTILRDFGYTVIEAIDGEDAIKKFEQNKDTVSLLLCDVIMPKKNGGEVQEEIRKMAPEARIIFMSGYPADIVHQKGLLAEEAQIILKPISPTALLKKVREALDKK